MSSEDFTPQKSILDFFKSPGKASTKPRDLLGYFNKTEQLTSHTKNGGSSKPKPNGAVVKVGILESKDNGAVVNVVSRWGCGQGRNT